MRARRCCWSGRRSKKPITVRPNRALSLWATTEPTVILSWVIECLAVKMLGVPSLVEEEAHWETLRLALTMDTRAGAPRNDDVCAASSKLNKQKKEEKSRKVHTSALRLEPKDTQLKCLVLRQTHLDDTVSGIRSAT